MTLKQWEIERRAALAKRAQESAAERACPVCGRKAAMVLWTKPAPVKLRPDIVLGRRCRWCPHHEALSRTDGVT